MAQTQVITVVMAIMSPAVWLYPERRAQRINIVRS